MAKTMGPKTEKSLNFIRDLRHGPRPQSFRGEIALAALVVAVYAAVFGSSLYALLGGETPDLLKLASDQTVEPRVAEVLSSRGGEVVSPEAQQPQAVPTRQPTPRPTSVPPTPVAARPTRVTAQTAPEPPRAQAPPQANTSAVASVSGFHLVRSGDTLSLLSVLYGVDVASLKAVNALQSDMIYAGQTLIVPRPVEASRINVARLGGY
jgi:LysM repeat protein